MENKEKTTPDGTPVDGDPNAIPVGAKEPTQTLEPTPQEPVSTPEPQTLEELVSVPKKDINALLNRIKRLESSANLAALAKYDAKNREAFGKIIRLRIFDEKIVVGWSDMIVNKCEKGPNGNWVEDQRVSIKFEDGSEQEMSYIMWANTGTGYKHIEATVKSEKTVKIKVKYPVSGEPEFREEREFELELESGKRFFVKEQFVN